MTANEMRNLFKELYDGASAQEMGFNDTEVSRFLNLSVSVILNEKIFSNRNMFKEGFEIGSKRDIELNNLKRNITLWFDVTTNRWILKDSQGIIEPDVNVITDSIMIDDSILFEIPNTILYILRDVCDIKLDDQMYRNIPIKNLNEDNVNDVLNNPFKKPSIDVIYRTIQKEGIDLNKSIKLYIPEGSEFYRWNCSYIKRPKDIVVNILNPRAQVNCELDETIHNDIVFKAVELAIGSIGSRKIQTTMYNSNKNIN